MDLRPPPPPPPPHHHHHHHHCHKFGEENGNVKTENEEDGLRFRFPPTTTTTTTTAKSRERRKRIRRRKTAVAPAADTENQRMTHIAVERNRRRLMNRHLSELRSLMPPSYVQRGDQASIVGGAIDFVKELEQLLQCLEAQKKRSVPPQPALDADATTITTTTGVIVKRDDDVDMTVASKSPSADVQVTVIQNHANLKIQCIRRPSQLLNAIVAFENLKFTVLHLNVTSMDHSLVYYSFSLKVEEDCKIGRSAAEIAAAVHQIFAFIADNQLQLPL